MNTKNLWRLLSAATLSTPLVLAAPITWSPATVIGASTDVSNPAGSMVHLAVDFNTAAGFGPDDGSINGIAFQAVGAGNDVVGSLTTDLNSGPNYTATFTPLISDDPDLDALVDSHSWLGGNPGEATITLEGLTPGFPYQVQLIGVGDTRGCCAGRIYEPDDGLGNYTTTVTVQRGLLQSTIGTFVADASTQDIKWRSLSAATGNNDPGLSGLVVLSTIDPTDNDGDGLPDAWEQFLIDFDGGDLVTGLADVLGPNNSPATSDFDGDGSSDADEFVNGTSGTNPDTDGDGRTDGQEATDGTNPLNPDSDSDGLTDGEEAAAGTNPTNPDTDSDGYLDGYEVANVSFGFDPLVDDSTEDPDNDGLDNAGELINSTDPTIADSDADGANDGQEVNGLLNPYTGGVFGVAPGDSTDPNDSDSDDDGINDFDETDNGNGFVTDPNSSDTDGDGFFDGVEIANASDPTDPGSTPAVTQITSRGTGVGALRGGDLTDPENDGMDAAGAGADPAANGWNWVTINSTDEPDFQGGEFSYNIFDNQVGGGNAKWCCNAAPVAITVEFAGPVALDSFTVTSSNDTPARDPRVWGIYGSNDGVNFDPIFEQNDPAAALWALRNEVLEFTLPAPSPPYKFIQYSATSTGGVNHALNEVEYFGVIDNTDSDGDGLPDWYEDQYAFLDPNNAADASLDQDGDGLNNLGEFTNGTDPESGDSDGDGLGDNVELTGSNGFFTNPLNADTDADGFNDGTEVSEGSDPTDPGSVPTLNPITWGPATNITGLLTDLDLSGTLVHAWNGGTSTITVGGISFVPGPSLGATATGFDPYTRPGSDPDYESLLNEGTYNGETRFLEITGLTDGADYQIQVWVVDTRDCCPGRLRSFSTDPSFFDVNQYVDVDSGFFGDELIYPGQYAIGTFTADGTTQPIQVSSLGAEGPQYNAIMVRQTSATVAGVKLTNLAFTLFGAFDVTAINLDPAESYVLRRSTDGLTFTTVAGSTKTGVATAVFTDNAPPAPTGGEEVLYQVWTAP